MKLENVGFSYGTNKVLEGLNYEFEKGKMYSITGRSGAGKTTLLSLISGLTSPSEGKISYEDKDIQTIDRYEFRSKWVGVIFQSFNLLTNLTALENVMLSMDISGVKKDDNKAYARELLHSVGLRDDEIDRRILKLSGGQQQRVAIARALSYDPEMILADEPTGNLDPQTRDEITALLRSLANRGKCVIIVTHSGEVAKNSDVIYTLDILADKAPAEPS